MELNVLVECHASLYVSVWRKGWKYSYLLNLSYKSCTCTCSISNHRFPYKQGTCFDVCCLDCDWLKHWPIAYINSPWISFGTDQARLGRGTLPVRTVEQRAEFNSPISPYLARKEQDQLGVDRSFTVQEHARVEPPIAARSYCEVDYGFQSTSRARYYKACKGLFPWTAWHYINVRSGSYLDLCQLGHELAMPDAVLNTMSCRACNGEIVNFAECFASWSWPPRPRQIFVKPLPRRWYMYNVMVLAHS